MHRFSTKSDGFGLAAELRDNISHRSTHDDRGPLMEEGAALQMVLEGIVLRQRAQQGGGLQTIATYHHNDVVNLGMYSGAARDERDFLLALKGTVIGHVPDRAVRELFETPKGARGLAALIHRELRISQENVASINRRNAEARMAHFFCETFVRTCRQQMESGQAICSMPMSQAIIGTIVGISEVHVNRVLQSLRARGLVELSDGHLTVKDFEGLADAADFDARYLDPV